MLTPEYIKAQIQNLYETNPHIHISISMQRAKVCIKDAPMVIKGVYRHIFQVEEICVSHPKRYSIQYTEVLIGQVVIAELSLPLPTHPKH